MHPAVRIVMLLVYAAGLSRLSAPALVVAGLPVAGALTALGGGAWREALVGIYRLRWLLVSIVVLYVVLEGALAGRWAAGVPAGLERCLALVLIIGAVRLLLATTGRDGLSGGVLYLARPFGALGLDVEALARRIAGTAARLEAAGGMLRETPPAQGGGRLQRLASRAASVFAAVEARIDSEQRDSAPVAFPDSPRRHEWLYPGALAALMLILGALPHV